MAHTQRFATLAATVTLFAACSTPPTFVPPADGFVDERVVGPSSVLYTDGTEVRLWSNGVTRALPDPFDASERPHPAWVGGAEDAMILATDTIAEWDGTAWRLTEISIGSDLLALWSAVRCGGETWASAFAPGSGDVRLFVRRDATFELVPNPSDVLGPHLACHDGHVMVASAYERFLRVDGVWSEVEGPRYDGASEHRTVDGRVVWVEGFPNGAPDGTPRGDAQITLTTWEGLERIERTHPLPLEGHTWSAPSDPDLAFDYSDVEVVLGPSGDVWIAVTDRHAAEDSRGGSGGSWAGPGGGGGRVVRDTRAVIYRWVEGGWSEVATVATDEYGGVDLGILVALAPGELSRMGSEFEDIDVRRIGTP
ncbi:MAG: hypothetical protein J0L92_18945 [Deltaproteobacteria bacterium]|nr:hypothetical protein [Deltaproteobacteria bacterium]